jgi:hypothetical protein
MMVGCARDGFCSSFCAKIFGTGQKSKHCHEVCCDGVYLHHSAYIHTASSSAVETAGQGPQKQQAAPPARRSLVLRPMMELFGYRFELFDGLIQAE